MNTIAAWLAGSAATETAQRAAVAHSDEARNAVISGGLSVKPLWLELYQTTGPRKLDPALAKSAIVGRVLDADQVRHVLDHEKRASVLAKLLETGIPDADTLQHPAIRPLLGKKASAKKLADECGGLIDHDALATIDPGELFDILRLWRLTSMTLSDDHVLDELLRYDEWGTPYSQRPMTLVLQQRPHLIPALAKSTSDVVRGKIAGSAHFGILDEDEQRAVLRLDKVAGKEAAWANAQKITWVSAGSNMTTKVDLLPDLRYALSKVTEDFNPTGSVDARMKYRNYSLDSLADEVDADRFPALLRWAAPTKPNGRPDALAQLIRNPRFGADEMPTVVESLHQQIGTQWEAVDQRWLHPTGRAVLDELTERFPDEMRPIMAKVARRSNRGWTEFREPDPAPAYVANMAIGGRPTDGTAWLEQRLGDDINAWHALFQVVDTVPTATVSEVADLACSL